MALGQGLGGVVSVYGSAFRLKMLTPVHLCDDNMERNTERHTIVNSPFEGIETPYGRNETRVSVDDGYSFHEARRQQTCTGNDGGVEVFDDIFDVSNRPIGNSVSTGYFPWMARSVHVGTVMQERIAFGAQFERQAIQYQGDIPVERPVSQQLLGLEVGHTIAENAELHGSLLPLR